MTKHDAVYDTVSLNVFVSIVARFKSKVISFAGKFLSTNTDYVVQQMRYAISDQKETIRVSTGLAPDVVKEYIENTLKMTAPIMETKTAHIDEFNEGWLYGFFHGLEEAEKDARKGVLNFENRTMYLTKFLKKQYEFFYAKWVENPTDFNQGAYEGYDNWLEELEYNWV